MPLITTRMSSRGTWVLIYRTTVPGSMKLVFVNKPVQKTNPISGDYGSTGVTSSLIVSYSVLLLLAHCYLVLLLPCSQTSRVHDWIAF